MRDNKKQFDLAQKEVEDPGNEKSVKERLGKIRENAEAARKIWKPENEDSAEVFFELFFLTLGKIEKASLGGDDGPAILNSLELRCTICHQTFREPE